MKLSILIPSVVERAKQLNDLLRFLKNIIDLHDLNDQVEVTYFCDNKEMTIGQKREQLYLGAWGSDYAWQIDDDDCIAPDAIPLILEAMSTEPDCITFQEKCLIDGVPSLSNFSLDYPDWAEDAFGYDHVRTPFFKTPIKTSICLQVPVPHIRFGEDHAWAKAIKPLLKTEVHIPQPLYYYTHVSSDHNTRYGIK